MANREDNTKKSNEEIELLSDDDLDNVTGGAGGWSNVYSSSYDDSQIPSNIQLGSRVGGK